MKRRFGPSERARFLDSASGGDAGLRLEVESLLQGFTTSEGALDALSSPAEIRRSQEARRLDILMQETLKNCDGLLQRCPELKKLQDRISEMFRS